MTAENIKIFTVVTVGIIVLIISFIPECILAKYESFIKAPMILKIYIIIHLGIIILGVLYISYLRPPEIYYYGL